MFTDLLEKSKATTEHLSRIVGRDVTCLIEHWHAAPVTGEVTEVDSNSFTIENRDGETLAFRADSETLFS